MGPGDLDQALCGLELPTDPNLLRGLEGNEDAGVYRLTDELALVQTVDVVTPIVDDPRTFGRIAAANAISDVYAMGGRPLTAMNIVAFPVRRLGVGPLRQLIEGGLEVIREAGAVLVGGHSVEDDELKYGLSVTGLVDPRRMMTNDALEPGQALVLTKPIGTGAVFTAMRRGRATPQSIDAMVASMVRLNRAASEAAVRRSARACTDVTGFGLAGHLVEMARASHVRVRLGVSRVPLLSGAAQAASEGLVPGGTERNRAFFSGWIEAPEPIDEAIEKLVFDPQTSGGLVVGLAADQAAGLVTELREAGVEARLVGEVVARDERGALELAAA